MDVLTAAIVACSLYFDEALVRALVEGQSQGAQYFVGDLSDLKSSSAPDLRAARALFSAVERRGHRPALGLMGVPIDWSAALSRTPADLWNPCINISIGTAKLSDFDYACRQSRAHARSQLASRECVVRHYADALGLPSRQQSLFVRAILQMARRFKRHPLKLSAEEPTAPSTDLFFGSPNQAPAALPPFAPLSETNGL
jgi:hypothetical protein